MQKQSRTAFQTVKSMQPDTNVLGQTYRRSRRGSTDAYTETARESMTAREAVTTIQPGEAIGTDSTIKE